MLRSALEPLEQVADRRDDELRLVEMDVVAAGGGDETDGRARARGEISLEGQPLLLEGRRRFRIETGQRRVDLIELVEICKACGADPEAEVLALVRKIKGTTATRRKTR